MARTYTSQVALRDALEDPERPLHPVDECRADAVLRLDGRDTTSRYADQSAKLRLGQPRTRSFGSEVTS